MCPWLESNPRLPVCKASSLSTRPGSPLSAGKLLWLCSHSPNDVPPEPQRNVSIAAVRGAVRPSISAGKLSRIAFYTLQSHMTSIGSIKCDTHYPQFNIQQLNLNWLLHCPLCCLVYPTGKITKCWNLFFKKLSTVTHKAILTYLKMK